MSGPDLEKPYADQAKREEQFTRAVAEERADILDSLTKGGEMFAWDWCSDGYEFVGKVLQAYALHGNEPVKLAAEIEDLCDNLIDKAAEIKAEARSYTDE